MISLFGSKLLVKFGHVVVPLRLEAGPRDWSTEAVFLAEALDLELSPVVSGAIGEDRFGAADAG